MIDDFAKDYLHSDLREIREEMLGKLDGLSEYDIRRPLTATGTTLLGLIKHLAVGEARYFGEVFGRPSSDAVPRWDDLERRGIDMWATEHETREEIIGRYRRVWAHSDATIAALPVDAPGHVPWWPRPDVKLFNVLVHVLTETNRHAGHADVLREHLDGMPPHGQRARPGVLGGAVRGGRPGSAGRRAGRPLSVRAAGAGRPRRRCGRRTPAPPGTAAGAPRTPCRPCRARRSSRSAPAARRPWAAGSRPSRCASSCREPNVPEIWIATDASGRSIEKFATFDTTSVRISPRRNLSNSSSRSLFRVEPWITGASSSSPSISSWSR